MAAEGTHNVQLGITQIRLLSCPRRLLCRPLNRPCSFLRVTLLNLLQVVYLHLNKRLSLSLSLPRRFPRTRRRSAGEIFGVSLAAVIVVVVSAATSIPAFRLLRRARTGLAAGWELMSTPRVCVRFLRLPSVVRGHRDSAAGWAVVASLSRWVPSPQPSSRSAASRFDRQREIGRRPHRFDSGHGARGS